LIKSVKEDTAAVRTDAEEIKTDTIIIKQDTSQIAGLMQEIGLLRLQILHLEDHGGRWNVLLERFLAQSTTYEESIVNTGDFNAVEFRRDPASLILEEGGTSDLESTPASENSDPNTPAIQATAFGLVGQAVVTTFPIRKYLGGELLGSKNGMKFIRN
jgi:hypothetical protein